MDLSMNQTGMDWPESLMPNAFRGLDLLRSVSVRGQKAAGLISGHGVWDGLAGFDPIVAGTFPINLDIDGSDIDILCHCPDFDGFKAHVQAVFGHHDDFGLHRRPATQHVAQAIVVRFVLDDLPVEIFATGTPSQCQFGFRHMLVEARLIYLLGSQLSEEIRKMKRAGFKTEPAFAILLELGADPYLVLDEMYDLGPLALKSRVGRFIL
ncbi:DUF4269 domain-containing protein [Thalassospira sp.]|uniref:DUF4269 domain-containing protein n=2 Tax=Thalassospiraceae TaxID=2844866 RepID=UPI0008DE52CC|nr:DUF4269 domain-containing protein [Thalassospira sp.]OHY98518.1 hypothetical protein BC440_11775 [Thalassospira sp. MIT1004]|tara:strand:+ start:146 stop:772 length:627 start_codon:yes stop_codon:yes gene_type:complete